MTTTTATYLQVANTTSGWKSAMVATHVSVTVAFTALVGGRSEVISSGPAQAITNRRRTSNGLRKDVLRVLGVMKLGTATRSSGRRPRT